MSKHLEIGIALTILFLAAGKATAAERTMAFKQESNRNLELDSLDEPNNFYIGVGIGAATSWRHSYSQNKSTRFAYKFLLGYAVNDYFATEVAYINLGSHTEQSSTLVLLGNRSFVGSGILTLPLGDYFSLSGRIGYANYQTSTPGRTSDTGDFCYGIITSLNLHKHFSVRAEYETVVGGWRRVYDVTTISGVWKF